MVAKVRFWLLESSSSIAKASLSVDIKIVIPIFFVYNQAIFYKEGNTSSLAC